ncbi:CD276 antigen homolog isoform X2 [Salmo salar]|nr:CD276 antigen homolog isoform X2 [Salmo salar]|eukprot:XP_014019447.1 PREDICTED: CD276 antigen homolog isoform X2 [Salmo salar]
MSSHLIIGILGKSIMLPCSLNSSAPVVPASLTLYWTARLKHQKEDQVVHALYNGKENNDPQFPFYRNRTQIFKDQLSSGNFSLLLKDLRVEDDLTTFFLFYHQEDGNYNTLNQNKEMCLTTVKVAKSYHKPIVTVNYEEWKAECTSQGGYPKPRLTWTNQNGLLDPEVPQIVQDPGSGTMNISSTVNITENQTVTCAIFNPTLKETLNTTRSTGEEQVGLSSGIKAGIGVVAVAVIGSALVFVCWKSESCNCYLSSQLSFMSQRNLLNEYDDIKQLSLCHSREHATEWCRYTGDGPTTT